MSLRKFGPKDIIRNTMRTHPSCEFFIYAGGTKEHLGGQSKVYYNNTPAHSGVINPNLPVTSGYVSLYELNVDRVSGSTGRFIGGSAITNEPKGYTLSGASPGWVTDPTEASIYTYTSTNAGALVGHWRLDNEDEMDDDETYTDSGTGSFDGAIANTYGPESILSVPSTSIVETGFSADFLAADENSIEISDNDALTFGTSGFTIAAWIYPVKTDGADEGSEKHRTIVHKGGNSVTNIEYHFALETDDSTDTTGTYKLRIRIGSSSGVYMGRITDDYEISEGEWTHVVVTHDGTNTVGNMKFYINGTEITDLTNEIAGTYTAPMQNTSQKLYIGSRNTNARFFNGYISNVSMWNMQFTDITVNALYYAQYGIYTLIGEYAPSNIVDNKLIYPFVTKDGTRVSLRSLYTGSTYEMDFQYGDVVSGSYPMSASITRELIGWYPKDDGGDSSPATGEGSSWLERNGPYAADESGGSRGAGELNTGELCLLPSSEVATCEEVTTLHEGGGLDAADLTFNSPKWRHYWALKNLYTDYEYLSEHFALTSSYGIKDHQIINLISIPSIFYGAKIEPGTVSLKWYLTGTLIGELQDTKQNGELIEITTSNPYVEQYGADNVAGVVFYDHGFIALTGSWYLNKDVAAEVTIRSGSGNTFYSPMWIDWGAGANDNCNKLTTSTSGAAALPDDPASGNNFESASFNLSFKGRSDVQTITMFAHAKRGEANYSNNPTFLVHTASVTASFVTSSNSYIEDPDRIIFSFVSSSYPDYSASFERQVYISKVGLYDENKNLIGIASLSNPVRKEEAQDLTFKLKLDI